MADQVQLKLRKRLEALLKLPENQVCADCRKRGPRWASANLGNFMCIECSGIHRNLGVHISFVRSVNLDSWTEKQVAFMEEWGNGRANALYEANVPAHVNKPKDGDSVRTVEKYIRDKYEHKRYMAKTIPPKTVHEEAPPAPIAERRTSVAKPVQKLPAAAAPAPPAPVAATPSLLDFMDEPVSTPASAPSPAGFSFIDQTPAQPQHQQQQGFGQQPPQQQGFSSFDQPSPVPHHVAHTNVDDFMNFVSAPPAVVADPFAPQTQAQHGQQQGQQNQQFGFPAAAPPVPPVPPKPQASADAILSLYSNGGSGMGGGAHHQIGMMSPSGGLGHNGPMHQQHHHQHQPMMRGGAPQMMMGGGSMPQQQFQQQQHMGQGQQFTQHSQHMQQQPFGGFAPQQQQQQMMMGGHQQFGGMGHQQQQPQQLMGMQQQQPAHYGGGGFAIPQHQQQQAQAPPNPFSGLGNVGTVKPPQQQPINPFQQQQPNFGQPQQGGWR